jgi:hypothetical protein
MRGFKSLPKYEQESVRSFSRGFDKSAMPPAVEPTLSTSDRAQANARTAAISYESEKG